MQQLIFSYFVIHFVCNFCTYFIFVVQIPELNTVRSLSLSERAITVALAVSLDCDYFSRHGGW